MQQLVGECTGLYRELVAMIVNYDGDTHMDEQEKNKLFVTCLQPLTDIKNRLKMCSHLGFDPHPLHILAIVLATHINRYNLVIYGMWNLPVTAYLRNFYDMERAWPGSTDYLNRENRTLLSWQSEPTLCPLFYEPNWQKLIIHPRSNKHLTAFKHIHFWNT